VLACGTDDVDWGFAYVIIGFGRIGGKSEIRGDGIKP
jgi:hypothetical protein